MGVVKNNYVNNKEFTTSLIEFVKAKENDEALTLRKYSRGEYIGECILKICNNLAKKSNFINYTFKDEMISDAIENCIKASSNFNGDKSSNAFGYFTMVSFNAFRRRIQKEKTQAIRRMQLLSDPKALSEIIEKQFDAGARGSEHEGNVQHFIDQLQSRLVEMDSLIDDTHKTKTPGRVKSPIESPLSKLMED